MFYFGDIVSRFQTANDFLPYVAITAVVIPFFGCLARVKGLDLWISPDGIKHLTCASKIALGVLICTLGVLLAFHAHLAWQHHILGWYAAATFAIPLIYVGLYWLYLKHTNAPYWHVHHWWTGFYCALLFRFNHPVSKCAFAVSYAVYVQGAIAFGVTPIITGPGSEDPGEPQVALSL